MSEYDWMNSCPVDYTGGKRRQRQVSLTMRTFADVRLQDGEAERQVEEGWGVRWWKLEKVVRQRHKLQRCWQMALGWAQSCVRKRRTVGSSSVALQNQDGSRGCSVIAMVLVYRGGGLEECLVWRVILCEGWQVVDSVQCACIDGVGAEQLGFWRLLVERKRQVQG